MYKEPEACLTKMKSLVHRLIHVKQLAGGITTGDAVIQQYTALLDVRQLAGGITTGDAVIQQYTAFLDKDTRDECFKDFDISESRVDSFLHEKVSARYPQLWGVCGRG